MDSTDQLDSTGAALLRSNPRPKPQKPQRHRVVSSEYPPAQGVCDITSTPKVTWFRRGLPWLDSGQHGQVEAGGWLNYVRRCRHYFQGGISGSFHTLVRV